MKSIYNWKYLKSKTTFKSTLEVFQIIEFQFFDTVKQIIMRPDELIESFLSGEKKYQNPIAFYLSSLVFILLVAFSVNLIFPEAENSDSNYAQYVITLPFILVISGMNYILFRRSDLNYISNLIIATYIEGQSIFYLTFLMIGSEFVPFLAKPMIVALFYSLIILTNLIIINRAVFKNRIFHTFWKSLVTVMIGGMLTGYMSSIILE
ncbi:MAG: DUF3667 domain-containing protein [Reichenbachiella sp.]